MEQSTEKTKRSIFAHPAVCLLLSAIVCALWGSLYTCTKYGYTIYAIEKIDGNYHLPSILLFTGIRFLICGAILVVSVSVKERKLRFPVRKSCLPILLIALLTVILHYALTNIGLATTDGGKTSVLKQVGYLVVSCFAFLFCKDDKFSIGKLFGGILGFASIIVMNLGSGGLSFSFGDFLIITASFCVAGGNIICKRAYRYESPVYVVAWSQLIGGVFLTLTGLIFGGSFHAFGWGGFFLMTYICAASIIAYCLWNILLKNNPLSLMSIYKFMEPLFGVVVSCVVTAIVDHTNTLSLNYLYALLILLAAIVAGNIKHKKKKEEL